MAGADALAGGSTAGWFDTRRISSSGSMRLA